MLWRGERRRWAAVLLIGSLAIATAQFSKGKIQSKPPYLCPRTAHCSTTFCCFLGTRCYEMGLVERDV